MQVSNLYRKNAQKKSRLGMHKSNLLLVERNNEVEIDLAYSSRTLGEKQYELTNHLGNVLAVISDKKLANNEPDVVSTSDYFPYGMGMPGRMNNGLDYRYGFTGHEKENEITEGIYSTEYRLYDSRLVIWRSIDPLFGMYPGWSSYVYCRNNPMRLIDPTGMNDEETETTIIMPQLDNFEFTAESPKEEKPSWISRQWTRFKNALKDLGEKTRYLRYQDPGWGNNTTGTSAINPGEATEEYGPGMDVSMPSISGGKASKSMESVHETVSKFDWESIWENALGLFGNKSSEQTSSTPKTPLTPKAPKAPNSNTTSPNKQTAPTNKGNTQKLDNLPTQYQNSSTITPTTLDVDSSVIRDLYRAIDSVNQIQTIP